MIDEKTAIICREKIDRLAEMFFPNLSNVELIRLARQFENTLK